MSECRRFRSPSPSLLRYAPRVLKAQTRAPDFTVTTTDGRTLKLSELRGRHVVLFFFPKAFTGG